MLKFLWLLMVGQKRYSDLFSTNDRSSNHGLTWSLRFSNDVIFANNQRNLDQSGREISMVRNMAAGAHFFLLHKNLN